MAASDEQAMRERALEAFDRDKLESFSDILEFAQSEVRRAVAEEREACANAVCPLCASCSSLNANGKHLGELGEDDWDCVAAAIRARDKEQGNG